MESGQGRAGAIERLQGDLHEKGQRAPGEAQHHKQSTSGEVGKSIGSVPVNRSSLWSVAQIWVEAAGVELIKVLRGRRLLILGSATTGESAPLPDRLCEELPFQTRSDATCRPPYSIGPLQFVGQNSTAFREPNAENLA